VRDLPPGVWQLLQSALPPTFYAASPRRQVGGGPLAA